MARKKDEIKPFKNIGVCYARFSSHNQKDVSIEQQVAACRKKAEAFNITLIETYEDRAISGKTDRRTNFQRMMKDAEKGKFEYLIAWKSSRIGRNMLEQLINEAKLQAWGVRILYVEESFDDTAAGRFAARNMMNINQFYSENMAEDVLRAMNDNASKCLVNGLLPFGYKKGEDGKFAINEHTAPIAREIFQRVANRQSFVDIYNDLNARGIKTTLGREWNRSSFHRMLTNERYRGVYVWKDTRIEGGVPRIVSDELYFKVQEVLKTKKNAQGRHRVFGDYLLTGKLFCGYCGGPMIGYSGTSKSGALHHYYVCNKRRLEHTCKKENVRRDDIEFAVAKAIQEHALKQDVIEWIAEKTVAYNKKKEKSSHIFALEEQLKDTQKAIKNIMTAIEQGIITDTTRDRLLELEAEQSQMKANISAARADIISIPKRDLIASMAILRDGDINSKEYRMKLFNTFLVAVYLYDDHFKIVFSFTGPKKEKGVPFDLIKEKTENNENAGECSYKLTNASPKQKILSQDRIFCFIPNIIFKNS